MACRHLEIEADRGMGVGLGAFSELRCLCKKGLAYMVSILGPNILLRIYNDYVNYSC